MLSFVIYILITCLKVNTGKIYLENIYTNKNNSINEKDNWFTKKKGNNCGIILIFWV
jgi:hypothetical protein